MPDAIVLSIRQLGCLQRVAKGETSIEIARALGLSKRTVDHYLAIVCARLGVKNRAQAVAKAIQLKLIEPPGD